MIYYIKGKLELILETEVVIDVSGVGISVTLPSSTLTKLQPGQEIILYTSMLVKEDGVSLFGFLSLNELNMFNLLKTVTGVGPKAALSLLSALPLDKLTLALASSDEDSLSKAPGIGKKTAQRLILELRDKLKSVAFEKQQANLSESSSDKQDAIDALIALGYSKSESMKAVFSVATTDLPREQIIKQALRKIKTQ